MKKQNFDFLKKPEFWITTFIAIILTFAGFFSGKAYVYYYGDYHDIRNNTNCLINSPNSVQSNYQQSGITAQTVNINAEKPDRHLNEEDITELTKFLPSNKHALIQVRYLLSGGSEAQQYALEIRSYLKSEGWNVSTEFPWSLESPFVGVGVYNESGTILIKVGNKP